MHIYRLNRNKSPLKFFGKVAVDVVMQGLPKIFRAPIHRAHRAVTFAIAQLSCLRLIWHGAAEFAAAGFYWRRRQPGLSRRAGSPAGFDRSRRKSDGGAAEGSNFYASCSNGNKNEYCTIHLLSVLIQLITLFIIIYYYNIISGAYSEHSRSSAASGNRLK